MKMFKDIKNEEIKVFTYDYVNELQRNVEIKEQVDPYKLEMFPYQEKFPKGSSGVFVPLDFEFKNPEKGNNFDLDNSIAIYEKIKGINPTIASDPRLWTYLTHVRFFSYMKNRWPIDDLESPKNRIIDRYHLKYLKLESLTRNGISRLWWFTHLTIDNNRKDKFELTRTLLSRADLTVGILERALGSNKNIRVGILEFLAENDEIRNNEDKSRNLLIQLNLYGGVKNLPHLSINEIKMVLGKIKTEIL
jgi:hypothetical protein